MYARYFAHLTCRFFMFSSIIFTCHIVMISMSTTSSVSLGRNSSTFV